MAQVQCPNCGSKRFHIKNPDEANDIYEFEYRDGHVFFGVWIDEDDRPTINDDTEIFCNVCGWQGNNSFANCTLEAWERSKRII